MNSSPDSAWSRTFEKYSPTKYVKHSPVISTQGKVLPSELINDRAENITWLLSTTEEYYYQNILELMSIYEHGLSSINKLLRMNRQNNFWPEILINIQFIGKGAFGDVYKALDKRTEQIYAVKQISSQSDVSMYNLMTVLLERNAYIRSNQSSFIVKLYGAFQDAQSSWMVFEYCIGDLQTFLSAISIPAVTFMDKFLEDNVIIGLYNAYNVRLSLDVESIAFVYSFELLAGLDYLGKRRLIHRDLKPDNILTSITGHLKIGDLGLTQRLRWIDRKTAIDMVQPSSLKDLEKEDLSPQFSGNILYADPESIIYYKMLLSDKYIYKNLKSLEFPVTNGEQDFLSDLYSVSLIIMELLFVGMNFITTEHISADVARNFHIVTSSFSQMSLFRLRCIYDSDVHFSYLFKILNNQITANNTDLLNFMKSCFTPKRERALKYTKDINYFRFKKLIRGRCIDIEKIEAMKLYKSRNITNYNVNKIHIQNTVINFYKRIDSDIQGLTFTEFQEKVNMDKNDVFGVNFPSFRYTE